MTAIQIIQLYVFILAGFVGFLVITKVPPLLHTPLMAATNAISGISLVGSIVLAGGQYGQVATILGFIAVVCAMTNVVGGFIITDRMLSMFKRADSKPSRQETTGQGGARERAPAPDRRPAHGGRRGVPADHPAPPAPRSTRSAAASWWCSSCTWSRRCSSSSACARSPSPTRRGAACSWPRWAWSSAIVGTLLNAEILTYLVDHRRPGARHRVRLSARQVRAHDGDAAAHRLLAHVRRAGRDARGRGRVLPLRADPGGRGDRALQDGRHRLRGALRLAHGDRQLHGLRQAAGVHHRAPRHVQGAELLQPHAVRGRVRVLRLPDLQSGRRARVLRDARDRLRDRHPDGHADRRCRHAGGGVAAQLVRRPRGLGHRASRSTTTCSSSPARSTAPPASSSRSSCRRR